MHQADYLVPVVQMLLACSSRDCLTNLLAKFETIVCRVLLLKVLALRLIHDENDPIVQILEVVVIEARWIQLEFRLSYLGPIVLISISVPITSLSIDTSSHA